MKLKDKVAIITGGGSGIGKASATLFAKEGARVIVADINEKSANEVVAAIRKDDGVAMPVKVDVASSADIERMVKTTIATYGRVDILFNNAGIGGDTLENTSEKEWHRVVDINLTGPYLACLQVIPHMRKQRSGNILNTGSAGAFRAAGRSPAYSATKGGIVMLSKTLAIMLAKDNIRVNCLCPGSTDTALTDAFLGYPKTEEERRKKIEARASHIPLGRAAKPEEIAAVALFMVSDDAAYVTGAAWLADGGITA
ncbi:MAG: glucose 1-dehydrogenase [Chloroflexi bacterium]|nr:glucose 1-dehydrogenase [Chloroflexota bacterium]